jgi:MFS family permease
MALKRHREKVDSTTGPELPRSVWVMSWVSFFADVSSEMVYPLLPMFLVHVLGSSKTQLGIMEGGAVLIVALMSAYAGMRSDRCGGKGGRLPWIRWGYGLPVLGKAIIAVSTVWPMVFGGRLLDRFGKGLRGAPRDALLADSVEPEQRGRAFGLHRAFDTAGAMIGVLMSAFLLWLLTGTPQSDMSDPSMIAAAETPAWVYRVIFAIGSALGIASLLISFLLREPVPVQTSNVNPTMPSRDTQNLELHRRTGWWGLPKSYWIVLAILVLFSLANSSDTFLLLRARDLGYSPWAVVLVYAVYNFFYSALSYPAGAWSDRIGRWRIIALGWAIYAGVYAGFAFLPESQAWGMWPLMTLYGIYMALTEGIGKAMIADHAPPEARGKAMGLFYGLIGLTTLLASLLFGLLWDFYGATAAFLVGSGFAFLALIALALARNHLRAIPAAGPSA